jgi:predicted phosphodiesterase
MTGLKNGTWKSLITVSAMILFFAVTTSVFAGGDDPESGFNIKPCLQVATQTSVGVMWETHNNDTGEIDISLSSYMSGAVSHYVSTNTKRHEIVINGLVPNTRYYYRVSSDGETSSVGSFVTALEQGTDLPFRFLVYGDSRRAHWAEDIIAKYGDNDDHLPVCQSMDSCAPDFILHVGDFVYSGNDMDDIYNFFDVEKDLLANNPLVPIYGNHEFDGGSGTGNTLMDNYLIPAPGGTFDYYSYDYGNVHILVVNTGEGVQATDNFDLLAPGTAQHNFITADLAAASTNSGIDHVFVALHAPPYSVANFGDNQQLINYLEPLFIQYNVKAVFMGHEHDYQHQTKNGVHYILSGGAGSSVMDYPWKGDENDSAADLLFYDDVLNYVIVDVNGSVVNFTALKVQGNGNSATSVLEVFQL